MKPDLKRLVGTGWALAAALVVVACAQVQPPSFTPMATIPTERRTHCLGRFLIDLPADFQQDSGPALAIRFYYGLDKDFETVDATMEPELFTPEQFNARVAARYKELNETINRATKGPMLLHAEKIASGAALFRRHDTEFYDSSIKSEVHQLVGNRYVRYEQASYDSNSPLGSKRTRNIDPKPAEDRLKQIVGQLHPWNPQSREAQPGFCFQGVVFDIGQSNEATSFNFESGSAPDLRLEIEYNALAGQPSESLFSRARRPPEPGPFRPRIDVPSIDVLRQSKQALGGMKAQEVLATAPSENARTAGSQSAYQQVFMAETDAKNQSVAQPYMFVLMITGESVTVGGKKIAPKGSSIPDLQALELWDQIFPSIRPRPGAVSVRTTERGEVANGVDRASSK